MRALFLSCGLLLLAAAGRADDKIEINFEYKDSQATKVAVVGEFSQGRPIPMVRNAEGVWSCRLSVTPGYYAYMFYVDGAKLVFDPSNPDRKTSHNHEYSALKVGDVRPAVPPPAVVTPPPPTVMTPPKIGKPLIDISVVPTKGSRNLTPDWYYNDEWSQSVQVQVTVKSREMQREYKKLSGELYVLSRGLQNTRDYQLIIHETKTFDLPIRETMEYKSGVANLRFDRGRGNKYGYKYYGYLYILRDSSGTILMTESVPENLMDNFDSFRDRSLKESFGM